MATRYVQSIDADPVTRDVLARWTYVIETLADDPMQLEREVDWVIKQRVIQAYMEKNRLSWRDPKVSLMDLQYHDIRPDKGLYLSLVRRGLVDRITDRRGDRARQAPPPADHPGAAPRRVHPSGQPQGEGLPRRLGLSEAQRPRARDHPLQGPVPEPRRAGGAADPQLLGRAPGPRRRFAGRGGAGTLSPGHADSQPAPCTRNGPRDRACAFVYPQKIRSR